LTVCILEMILLELAYLRAVSIEKSASQLRKDAQAIWTHLISNIEVLKLI
jgi:hypothetical protein